jgi:NAD(P)H-dependent FMN reductase
VKILAILGSPKKMGTGYKVVQQVERKMKELGDFEIDYLFLKDADLGLCRGCFLCVAKGEDLCPMNEDRMAIEKRIEGAGGIILVSPGYVQNVSWLMKNFIDRFAYTHHRPKFLDKKVMIIANGGAGLAKVLDSLRIAIGGPEVVSELAYVKTPWPISPKVDRKQEKRLEQATEKFCRALSERGKEPSFASYMAFRFFKEISPSVKEHLPADYEFYKDKKDYYYDTKIGASKKICASILFKIVTFFMRDMAPYEEKEAKK